MKITKLQLDVIMEAIDDFTDMLPKTLIDANRALTKATIADLKYHIMTRFIQEDEVEDTSDYEYQTKVDNALSFNEII